MTKREEQYLKTIDEKNEEIKKLFNALKEASNKYDIEHQLCQEKSVSLTIERQKNAEHIKTIQALHQEGQFWLEEYNALYNSLWTTKVKNFSSKLISYLRKSTKKE